MDADECHTRASENWKGCKLGAQNANSAQFQHKVYILCVCIWYEQNIYSKIFILTLKPLGVSKELLFSGWNLYFKDSTSLISQWCFFSLPHSILQAMNNVLIVLYCSFKHMKCSVHWKWKQIGVLESQDTNCINVRSWLSYLNLRRTLSESSQTTQVRVCQHVEVFSKGITRIMVFNLTLAPACDSAYLMMDHG